MSAKSHSAASAKSSLFTQIILPVLLIAAIVTYATSNFFEQAYQYLDQSILNNSNSGELVNYYQWTDSNGQVVISRDKPNSSIQFITFQASNDLMTTEHNLDQELVDKSEQYRASARQQKIDKQTSSSSQTSGSGYVNTFNKAKNCIELSNQMANARSSGKDFSALKAKHAKECG